MRILNFFRPAASPPPPTICYPQIVVCEQHVYYDKVDVIVQYRASQLSCIFRGEGSGSDLLKAVQAGVTEAMNKHRDFMLRSIRVEVALV